MKKNVGKIDRYARIVISISAIGAGIAFQSWWGAVGLVPLVTAFIKWCPAYSILRFNTCNPFGKGDTCGAEIAG
jgi:hypothetical protein